MPKEEKYLNKDERSKMKQANPLLAWIRETKDQKLARRLSKLWFQDILHIAVLDPRPPTATTCCVNGK